MSGGKIAVLMSVTALCLACLTSFAAEEGLVAYWDFDEGSGVVVKDKSGSGNDGKIYGDASYVKVGEGYALKFDGKGDYVYVPDSDSLVLTNKGTIEMWVLVNSYPPSTSHPTKSSGLLQKGRGIGWDCGSYFVWYHVQNSTVYGAVFDGTKENYVAFGKPPVEKWHHLVFSWDGNNLRCYLNGNTVQTKPQKVNAMDSATPIWIGRSRTAYFNGLIDEVKIYNHPLTEKAVASHYKSTKNRYGR